MHNKNHLFLHSLNPFNKKSNHNNSIYNPRKDIKNIFTEKIKFKLKKYYKSNSNDNLRYQQVLFKKNNNKKKKNLIKLSFSKNSQTTIKNYKYFDFNNTSKHITNESYNNSKIIKSNFKLYHSTKDIHKFPKYFDMISKNKKPISRNIPSNQSLYKSKDLVYNIDFYFNKEDSNKKCLYKEDISDIVNKNRENNKFEANENINNKNDIKFSKSEINIFNLYNKNSRNKKKFIGLTNDISYMQQYNKFLLKSNYFSNPKPKEKKSDWKNDILENIITNITNVNKKENKINFYDDNYNHQNIKMFTILDLHKKNQKNF